MKTHTIPLELFEPNGRLIHKMDNGELFLTSKVVLETSRRSYASLPTVYKLPLRIDVVLKANSSNFKLQAGMGYVRFSEDVNKTGGGIKRVDILTGKDESIKFDRSHELPLGECVNVSVVYGSKITWIEINGNCCYSTRKAAYIDLLESGKIPDEFTDGLGLAIGVGKNVELMVKSFTVTEYENDEPTIPAEIVGLPELSDFDWFVKSIHEDLREEVIRMDNFLMNDMKSNLKFRKTISKYGNLSYLSPCGFGYNVFQGKRNKGAHDFVWIQKQNRVDFTNDILSIMAESSPEFAEKLFSKAKICDPPNGEHCSRRTKIVYKDEVKSTCSSGMGIEFSVPGFEGAKKYIAAVNEAIQK